MQRAIGVLAVVGAISAMLLGVNPATAQADQVASAATGSLVTPPGAGSDALVPPSPDPAQWWPGYPWWAGPLFWPSGVMTGGRLWTLVDLIPVPRQEGGVTYFCVRDGEDLEVTVGNQGSEMSQPTTTEVDFFAYGTAPPQITPALGPGQVTVPALRFHIPLGCFDADCEFRITVNPRRITINLDTGVINATGVPELNYDNNVAEGRCIG